MTELLRAATDQASGLRRLFKKQATPVVAFISSQSDHGRLGDRIKVMMQFADDFISAGKSVTILDEHPAPGSAARAYGVISRKDFKHVLHGDYPIEEVMSCPIPGLGLIHAPRAAGMEFSEADAASLAGNLALLRKKTDCVMVDCVYRTQRALSPIASQADQLVAIVPANDAELTQAYGLIKRVVVEHGLPRIAVVVTRAADAAHAKAIYDKLRRVAGDHLGVPLQYLGAAMTPGVRRLPIDGIPPSSRDNLAGFAGASLRPGLADSVV